MTRDGIWLAAFVLVVFSAGLATGVVLQKRLTPAAVVSETGPPLPSPGMLISMLAHELELTADQRTQLEQLVKARRQKVTALRGDVRNRIEKDASGLVAEIQTDLDLTPEQRARFEAFVARVRARYSNPDPTVAPR
jgi:Spy/CpxP family protein refolding chaperone